MLLYYSRENVVNNVVLDNTMEDVATDKAEFTINGGKSALGISPVLSLVVRGFRVGVMKVSNGNY
jgi:hypothetical protein